MQIIDISDPESAFVALDLDSSSMAYLDEIAVTNACVMAVDFQSLLVLARPP